MSSKMFRLRLLQCSTCSLIGKTVNFKPLDRLYLCSSLSTWQRPSFAINFNSKNHQNYQIYNLSLEDKLPVLRLFSMSSPVRDVDYDELIKLQGESDVIVIDVREKDELKETGEIPGSFNIPVGEVAQALTHLNDEQFRKLYGFPKPTCEKRLVFSCRSGKRSLIAYSEALKAGYEKSLNFKGGWLSWEENTKLK